ncbi:MAG: hypothetical protein IKU07_04525 [Oscillospiraceae bacterium]|nr:hypothetical protein [Oscillospiraceae bacterium]
MKKTIAIALLTVILIVACVAFGVSAAQEGVYCPHCDTYVTDWTEWTASASGSHSHTAGGHYYLAKNFTGMGGRYGINTGTETVVLDLRGHAIESTNNRCFFVSGGTLAIIDSEGSGTMTGARDGDGNLYVASGATIDMYGGTAKTSRTSISSTGSCGSVLYVLKGGTFNLHGGTLDGSAITTRNTMSGTACVKGTMNIYGGTISGGNSTYGGNVYLDGGTLNMTGGTITGGQAVNGGNIYTKNAATVTIGCDTARNTVAMVTKGHATTTSGLGGNLCVNGGSTVNLYGGKITDGISDARGGNISNGGANTYNITSGEMTGGSAGTDGANMFVNNGSVALNISGGYIDGGMDIRLTPNISLSGAPVITDNKGGLVLNLGTTHAKLQLGELKDGAEIYVSASGAFTDALENAESYLQYIKPGNNALQLAAQDNKLVAGIVCPHCDKIVEWVACPLTNGGADYAIREDAHYYLTQDLTKVSSQFYIGVKDEATPDVVIDLRGHKVQSTSRAFYVRPNAKLSVVDTAAGGKITTTHNKTGGLAYVEKNGSISVYGGTFYSNGTSAEATWYGGVIYAETGGTVNIAGGELYGAKTTHGGVIYAAYQNTVNITGGKIYGGEVATAGGAVYIYGGTLNMSGGTVTGGSANNGGNLYINKAVANLTGGTVSNGSGSYGGNIGVTENGSCLNLGACNVTGGSATGSGLDIYLSGTGALKVLKTFAGNASVGVNTAHLTDKNPGAALNTALDSAEGCFPGILTLESISTKPQLCGADGETGLYIASAALADANLNLTWYANNKSAVANYGSAVCLLPAAGDLELTGGNYLVDVGGKTIAITGTGNVTCFDSSNDTFETFGTVTVNGPALQNQALTNVGGKDYVTLNESGTLSFHRLEMGIHGVTLRPSVAGFYYTGLWQMDDYLATKAYGFGVAVSTAGAPTVELMAQDQVLWTAFKGEDLKNGTPITGALIANVLKEGERFNDVRGRTSVFGATYLALADGTVLLSEDSVNYSLYDVMQALDETAYAQNADALNAFYNTWKDVLSGWQLQNIGKTLLEKNGIPYIMGDVLYESDFEEDTVGQLPEGWSAGLYGGTGNAGTSFGWTGSGGTASAQVTEFGEYGKVYQVQSSNADAFTAMPAIHSADYFYEAELYIIRKGGIGLANNFYAPTYDATGVMFTSMYPGTTNACKYTYKGQPLNKSTEWENSENPTVGEVVKLQILSVSGKNYIFNNGKVAAICDSRAGGNGVDYPGFYTCGGSAYVLNVKVTEILSAKVEVDSAKLGLGENTALMELNISAATDQPFYRYYMAQKFASVKFGAILLVADTDASATLDKAVAGAEELIFDLSKVTVTEECMRFTAALPIPAENYEKWYCVRPFVEADGTRIYSDGAAYMPVELANSAYYNAPTQELKALIKNQFGALPGFRAEENAKALTFTLFSDFHYKAGMYASTIADLNTILKRADDTNSAFVLSAGDLTNDALGSPELFKAFLNYETAEGSILPAYNIYGNHELEAANTMTYMTPRLTNDENVFWGTADGSYAEGIGYYCFESQGFRVICLDSEYSFNPSTNQWEHNKSGSSGWPSGNTKGGSLGPQQLAWLEAVLMDAASNDIPCVVVAHDGFTGMKWANTSPDSDAVRALYAKANKANPGTVLMSINGHIHTNHQGWNDGVFYFDTNTVRNAWWQETAVDHYTAEHTFMYEEYDDEGNLIDTYLKPLSELSMAKKTWFSEDPLSCVITVSTDGMVKVDGAKSDWAYGIAPTTTADGVMCEITSGTFWDCDRLGHLETCEHN